MHSVGIFSVVLYVKECELFERDAGHIGWQERQACKRKESTIARCLGSFRWGFSRCEPFEVADTQGFVAWDSKVLVISFRGTECLADWLSDLDVWPEVRPYGVVHQGFFKAFSVAQSVLVSILNAAGPSNKKVWITGHSLGGALGTLAACRLTQLEPRQSVAMVYTFGAPRVGRADFVAGYNAAFGSTTYRLVHGRDVVATVPPSELGFHHVGRFLSCESGAKFNLSQLLAASDSDEPSSGSNFFIGVAGRLRNLFGNLSPTARVDAIGRLSQLLAPSIGDHLPDRYFTALTP